MYPYANHDNSDVSIYNYYCYCYLFIRIGKSSSPRSHRRRFPLFAWHYIIIVIGRYSNRRRNALSGGCNKAGVHEMRWRRPLPLCRHVADVRSVCERSEVIAGFILYKLMRGMPVWRTEKIFRCRVNCKLTGVQSH